MRLGERLLHRCVHPRLRVAGRCAGGLGAKRGGDFVGGSHDRRGLGKMQNRLGLGGLGECETGDECGCGERRAAGASYPHGWAA